MADELASTVEGEPPRAVEYDEIPTEEPSYFGGDRSLSVSEANAVTSRDESVVILVAGDVKAGKTTLVVELFAAFLSGPVSSWSFAGSSTLRALDLIHQDARLSSGNTEATTERTQADDIRLLHVRVQSRQRRVSLLLSDVRGEFFEDLVNGADVAVAAPIAGRADRAVVVLDGAKVLDSAGAREAIWRANQLIGALTEQGGLPDGTPALIALTKSELLSERELREFKAVVEAELLAVAKARGLEPEFLAVSARPQDPTKAPKNLAALLKWLTKEKVSSTLAFKPDRHEGRFSWRPEVVA